MTYPKLAHLVRDADLEELLLFHAADARPSGCASDGDRTWYRYDHPAPDALTHQILQDEGEGGAESGSSAILAAAGLIVEDGPGASRAFLYSTPEDLVADWAILLAHETGSR